MRHHYATPLLGRHAFTCALLLVGAQPVRGHVTCALSPCPSLRRIGATHASFAISKDQLAATYSFLNAIADRPWRRVVAIDVGANNGKWAEAVWRLCKERRGGIPCEVIMFEPQPRWASRLAGIHQSMAGGSRFEPAAAWHSDGTINIFLSDNSQATSMSLAVAAQWNHEGTRPSNMTVRSLDLARYMRETLLLSHSDMDVLTLLKIDVESAEYELLPHLVARRALCGIRYLHIEWHVDALSPASRLAGLGLMHSLGHVLKTSCVVGGGTAPVLIVHEQSPRNNGLEVPGLSKLLELHKGHVSSVEASQWTRNRNSHQLRGRAKQQATRRTNNFATGEAAHRLQIDNITLSHRHAGRHRPSHRLFEPALFND